MPTLGQERKPARNVKLERLISVALASTVVATVAIISFLPGHDKDRLHTSGRYHSWGHLLAFSAVSFVVARTTHSRSARILLFAGSLVLGLAIEYGEHKVYGNSLEWKDVLVDSLGVVCGTLLAIVTQPRQD
jgi:hypothetical protein